jgi:hypothetical protein
MSNKYSAENFEYKVEDYYKNHGIKMPHQTEVEVNPPKCKKKSILLGDEDDFPQEKDKKQCNKNCKCKTLPLNPYQEIGESAVSSTKTKNKFVEQRNYLATELYKIQDLVKTQSNDMLLGEAVRKLFL